MSRPKGLTDGEWRKRERVRLAKYRAKNRQSFNAQRRDHYRRYKSKITIRSKRWRDTNRESINRYARDYRKRFRKSWYADYRRRKYATDPVTKAKVKQRAKTYRKNNPMKCKAHQIRRQQKIKQQMPSNADLKLIGLFYDISKRVSECLGIKHHVDHIFPISKGGSHHQTNLQVLTAVLNQRKTNKIIPFRMVA